MNVSLGIILEKKGFVLRSNKHAKLSIEWGNAHHVSKNINLLVMSVKVIATKISTVKSQSIQTLVESVIHDIM